MHDGSGRCAKHPRQAWVKTKPTKRVTGRVLQRLRTALFEREPLCRSCKALGLVVLATQRDHIKPLEEGGTDTEDNVQPLCEPCHDAKSKAERERGLRRWAAYRER